MNNVIVTVLFTYYKLEHAYLGEEQPPTCSLFSEQPHALHQTADSKSLKYKSLALASITNPIETPHVCV